MGGPALAANAEMATVEEHRRRFTPDQQRSEELRDQFTLCEPASDLRPRDFGLQVLEAAR